MQHTTQAAQQGQRDQDQRTNGSRSELTALTLRLPSAVAERLRQLARAHSRSLNGEIVWALRAYVERTTETESERSNDDGTDE